MIGIDIRSLSSLKLLQPLCYYLANNNISYNVYNYSAKMPEKEYDRPTLDKIKASGAKIISSSNKIIGYNTSKDLMNKLKKDGVNKFIGVELFLNHKDIIKTIKENRIKTYSLLYLTDSMWNSPKQAYLDIDKIYFTSEFIMKKSLEYSGVKHNSDKHLFLGSPLYEQLNNVGSGNNTLVMLPNIRKYNVHTAFGSEKNFINIIKNLSNNHSLIFKTRKKQWFPKEIKSLAKEIIFDGDIMYPSALSSTIGKCNQIVLFNSSGVYEAVTSKKPVINIPINLNMFRWGNAKLQDYFINSGLYNFQGAVKSVEQLNTKQPIGNFYDPNSNLAWRSKFIGEYEGNSVDRIINSILE